MHRIRSWVLIVLVLGVAAVGMWLAVGEPPPPAEVPSPVALPVAASRVHSVEVVALTWREGAPWLARSRAGSDPAGPPDGFVGRVQLVSMPPPRREYPALRITARDASGRTLVESAPGPEVIIRSTVDEVNREEQRLRASGSSLIPLRRFPPILSSRVTVTVEGSSNPPLVVDNWEVWGWSRPIYARATFLLDGGRERGAEVALPGPPGTGLPAGFDGHAEGARVLAMIREWQLAWQGRDLDRYIRAYDPDFWSQDGELDLAGWKKRKAAAFGKAGRIRLNLDRLRVSFLRADLAEVTFLQEFQSDSYSDLGDKSMLLRRGADGWRIMVETFRDNPEERRRRDQDRLLRVGIAVEPVDEGSRDADLVELRSALLRAVARRDPERLRDFVLPGTFRDRRTGRAVSYFETMRKELKLDDPMSAGWDDLELALRGGGVFVDVHTGEPLRRETWFQAPYRGPKGVAGRHDVLLLGAEDILVRSEPSPSAPVVRTVSHVLVKRAERAPYRSGWVAIELPDGGTGWVAERLTRGAFGRRATFQKKDGQWWLASFQGGC